MKIVRLSTFLDFGGLEKRLVNISHVDDSNNWIFACFNKEGFAAKEIKSNGKRVVNLKTKPIIYSIKTTYKLYKFLKKEKPDVLHTSGAEANFHGIMAGKLAGIKKIIAEEIGISSQKTFAKKVYTLLYKFANYVVGNSKPVINELHKNNNVPLSKLKQINNPIIFKPFKQYNFQFKPQHATHIISVSRLNQIKNIPSVIKVVSKIISQGENVYYHIYGDGEEMNNLKKIINQLKVSDKVLLHGFDSNPLEKLNAADIFILNSYSEGFSNALAEAMYCKKIVISTKTGSAEEMITHGKTGFLINVDNDENLYNQLKEVLTLNQEERERIQEAAHQKVISSYSLQNHLKSLYSIYN